jgi:outer membrane receptor protein involved in Fe transport
MKAFFIAIVLLLVIPFNTFSQPVYTITGVVKDSIDQTTIRFATVRLYANDKTNKPVKQVIADEAGKFTMGSGEGEYRIVVVHTGFAEKSLAIAVHANVDAGTIWLLKHTEVLAEVIVKSRKALVEEKDDRIIFNVSEDPLLKDHFATDALRVAPFVSIDGDGNTTVNGKPVKFLLNGKATGIISNNPTEVLKLFPANLIKRIEIITNPSAKYDAEGYSTVIDIISKKISGYNGAVGLHTNVLGPESYSVAPTLSIKTGKFGFTGFGGYTLQRQSVKSTTDFFTLNNAAAFSNRNLSTNGVSKNGTQWGTAEISWDLDSLTVISGYGRLEGGTVNADERTDVFINNTATADVTGYFENMRDNKNPSGEYGIDLIKKFKRNSNQEFSLSINRQLSDNSTSISSNQYLSGTSDRFLLNNNLFKNRQTTLQSDFLLPLKNTSVIEIGCKAILRNAVSNYGSLFLNPGTGRYEININNSNLFTYEQNVVGGYINYRFKIQKAFISAGIRFEHTDLTGTFITTKTGVEQSYSSFFPSLNMSKRFSNGQNMRFSCSRKISRPGISYLNPFVENSDSLFISYGQPGLLPEFSNNLELTYSWNKRGLNLSAGIDYSVRNDEIVPVVTFNNSTGVTTSTFSNGGRSERTSLNIFFSYRKNKIQLVIVPSVRYVSIRNTASPLMFNSGFTGNTQLNIDYDVTPNWRFRWSNNLVYPAVLPQGKTNTFLFYSFSTEYKLFKDKFRILAGTTRPFSRYLVNETVTADKANGLSQVQRVYTPYQTLRIGVIYLFGQLKENVSKKRGVSVDDVK